MFGLAGLVAVGAIAAQVVGKSARTGSNTPHHASKPAMSAPHADHASPSPSAPAPDHAQHGQAHDAHSGHSPGQHPSASASPASPRLSLTTATTISPNQPIALTITVQDPQGKPIAQFDTFQEKLMHLIVVSDDLQVFDHLHPDYKGAGRFEVTANFPKPGNYILFSDYKPAGQPEVVSTLTTIVPGSQTESAPIDWKSTKTVGNTAIEVALSAPTITAGQEVTVTFNLKDATSQQPIPDLQPYLGEQGHLVILKQSSPLTKADYIHAHAIKGTPAGQVQFMTTFPKPGNYKLWGQFSRNGTIVIGDFWVNVR